jgi:hypothetical protein
MFTSGVQASSRSTTDTASFRARASDTHTAHTLKTASCMLSSHSTLRFAMLLAHTYCTTHSAVVHIPRRPPAPAVCWHDYTLWAAIAFTAVHLLIWLCKLSAVLLQLARCSRLRRAAAVKANSRNSSGNGNSNVHGNGRVNGRVNGRINGHAATAAGAAATANSAAVNNGGVVQAH